MRRPASSDGFWRRNPDGTLAPFTVGHPGGSSDASDTLRAAPVSVWHGGFLNYSGAIGGRGGCGWKILDVKPTLGIELGEGLRWSVSELLGEQ